MKSPQVKCPTCKKRGPWFDGKFGPFCSKRCRLIDLGKWLGEEHAISEPLRPGHLEKFADLPPGSDLDQPQTD
ncbi:MAG: DNA gyrase inhibitor YacG [Verrucomicrobia bacterium]|nr:MAG: DNA gyrase inhibitor YacG [Verrucomicrobiota bacterium]